MLNDVVAAADDDDDNQIFSFVCDTRRIHNFYFKWVLKTRVNNMEHEQIFPKQKIIISCLSIHSVLPVLRLLRQSHIHTFHIFTGEVYGFRLCFVEKVGSESMRTIFLAGDVRL